VFEEYLVERCGEALRWEADVSSGSMGFHDWRYMRCLRLVPLYQVWQLFTE
jgi:hypothetical protein